MCSCSLVLRLTTSWTKWLAIRQVPLTHPSAAPQIRWFFLRHCALYEFTYLLTTYLLQLNNKHHINASTISCRSRSSKVDEFGANRKHICDFLLVRNSNLGPILHRFGVIGLTAFMCSWPHPYSTLILWVFPLHQIAHVGVSERISLKLFGREIIFEVFQTVWKTYLNVMIDRRTDGQTDDMQSHNRAVRASRGKNRCQVIAVIFFMSIILVIVIMLWYCRIRLLLLLLLLHRHQVYNFSITYMNVFVKRWSITTWKCSSG